MASDPRDDISFDHGHNVHGFDDPEPDKSPEPETENIDVWKLCDDVKGAIRDITAGVKQLAKGGHYDGQAIRWEHRERSNNNPRGRTMEKRDEGSRRDPQSVRHEEWAVLDTLLEGTVSRRKGKTHKGSNRKPKGS